MGPSKVVYVQVCTRNGTHKNLFSSHVFSSAWFEQDFLHRSKSLRTRSLTQRHKLRGQQRRQLGQLSGVTHAA